MSATNVTPATLVPFLEQCGYKEKDSRLAHNYRFHDGKAPLVGFFGRPWDARSACIAVVDANSDSRTAAAR